MVNQFILTPFTGCEIGQVYNSAFSGNKLGFLKHEVVDRGVGVTGHYLRHSPEIPGRFLRQLVPESKHPFEHARFK